MAKIIGYQTRQNKEGKSFIALDLQGDLVMVQSLETGRYYATAKRCSITSTFSEDVAKSLIGQEIQGRIERVQCESYEYTVVETGEVITLSHRYEFIPDTGVAATSTPIPMHVVRAA